MARFPSDLETYGNAITFTVVNSSQDVKTGSPKEGSAGDVELPLPDQLATGYNATYESAGIGAIGQTAMAVGSAARGAIAEGGGGFNSFAEELSTKVKAGGVDQAVAGAAYVGLDLLSGLASEAVGAGLAGANLAKNPILANLFNGVPFRKHSFSYRLIPRSASEASSIKEIIKIFKNAMHPNLLEGGYFFDYPDQFQITTGLEEQFDFKIGPSVLESFTVNYSQAGKTFVFNDNAPFAVQIEMAFLENVIVTKNTIQEKTLY